MILSLRLNVFFIMCLPLPSFFFFFFNDTATTEIYTLSLHDALPISRCRPGPARPRPRPGRRGWRHLRPCTRIGRRSEEHTSELQSHLNLVCRLLLEKKKKTNKRLSHPKSSLICTQTANAVHRVVMYS